MKKLFLAFALFCNVTVYAQQMTSEQYVAKYKSLAIESMIKYNIPASIKLAQGLVETASGNSRLAKEANNHFGIKCKSYWKGETISHDDDAAGECFRKYSSAEDSYIDHSEFLTNSERYSALFAYDITDYKAWAKGLSAAGYATNPKYPLILIKAIEDYELYLVDDEALALKKEYEREGMLEEAKEEEKVVEKPAPQIDKTDAPTKDVLTPVVKSPVNDTKAKSSKKSKKKHKKDKTKQQTSTPKSLTTVSIPTTTTTTSGGSSVKGGITSLTDKISSIFVSKDGVVLPNNFYDGPKFDVSGFVKVNSPVRDVYKMNNVILTIAKEGETFETIGAQMKLSAARLRGYNEVQGSNIRIAEGSVVYLSTKGTKVRNGFSVHTVAKGETLHDISQIYGVKMASLAKINGFAIDYELRVGQRVRLK